MRIVMACLWLGLTVGVARAADIKLLEKADNGSFKAADGSTLLYALARPQSPKLGKRYPLVIFLHGSGGMNPAGERNAQRSWDGAGQFFETMTNDCYFLMPQALAPWAGIPWDQLPYTMHPEPKTCQNQAVIECIEALLKDRKCAIDPNRVYLAGISMGSMGMWDLACRRPDLFAAGISACGGYDATQAPQLAKIKFRVFHGDADPIVPEAGSRAMVEALKAVGADVDYHTYPGRGHDIWEQTYRNQDNLDWLFRQRRSVGAGPSRTVAQSQTPTLARETVKPKSTDVALDENRPYRTWFTTDSARLDARLLHTRGQKAILAIRDGATKEIDVQSLSMEDRMYIMSCQP